MGTVAHFNDLRSDVVDALRFLSRSATQSVIEVGAEACEVDWSPDAYFHHTLLLPLVLLTAAIDEGAARTRWQGVSFVQAIDTAHQLDLGEKSLLLALAGTRKGRVPAGSSANSREAPERRGDFARELVAWIDSFDLAGRAVIVDRARTSSGVSDAHYGVRPVDVMREMPAALKALTPAQQLAAVALLALYNGEEAQAALKGKRHATMNPPAVAAFAALREAASEVAYKHLLRLIATYRGW